jgi:hypothetical protein
MEYNYEPLRDLKNIFSITREKLQTEILNYSLKIECEFDLSKLTSTKDFGDWLQEPLFELEKILIEEMETQTKNKIYFFGCPFEVYKLNYNARLQSYFAIYFDAIEEDFIKYELNKKYASYFNLEVNRYDLKQKFEYSIICNYTLGEQILFSLKARNKFLNNKLKTTNYPSISESSFNPNFFNQKAYNLFLYLVDNYEKKGKVKFINIFYFLKNEVKKDLYTFNFIQEKYTYYILNNYQMEIKKYAIPENFDVEKNVLNSLESDFKNEDN